MGATMDIGQAFELAPKSDQTVAKHRYEYKGLRFVNDLGHPTEYRILYDGKDLGVIKYYQGRKLACYEYEESA